MTIQGTTGNDHLTGTDGDDIFDLTDGGNDKAKGLAGNDTFLLGATFNALDRIGGGLGVDTLSLNGDYSGVNAVTMTDTTLLSVESIVLAAGHSYSLTTDDATVAKTAMLTVDGSLLGAADILHFSGLSETNGRFDLIGGAGADVLTGGTGNDTFDLTHGGNDTAHGGQGDDTFDLLGTLRSGDRIKGGSGNDTVELSGRYAGAHAVVFNDQTLLSVENLVLAGGHSYTITTNDATVGEFETLTVDASTLGHDDKLSFDGSADTDGNFTILAGAGKCTLTGGGGTDTFDLTAHHLTNADSIYGGGNNNYMILTGGLNIAFASTTIRDINGVFVAGGHDYHLTTVDANVSAGRSMYFNLSMLAGDTFTLNASAETDGTVGVQGTTPGHYNLTGGEGNDFFDVADGDASSTAIIHGSLGADTVYAEAAEGGTDTFIYNSAAQSTGRDQHDTLRFINFNTDHMEINNYQCSGGISVSSNATVNFETFDTDLAAAVSGHMAQEGAALVLVSNGTYTNHFFLVCDLNGDAAYTDGQDMVFDISATTGALSSAFFN